MGNDVHVQYRQCFILSCTLSNFYPSVSSFSIPLHYLAGVMELCGDKIVSISMDGCRTKDLVISALKDAICHTKATEGCILHSDRGSQDYQALVKEHGFISSMSQKGNCWDNAPMESFWGKLKQEWLNGQHFRTREEAKAAVFEYIWIFYNQKRIHEANSYLTPEEYYRQHQTDPKTAWLFLNK